MNTALDRVQRYTGERDAETADTTPCPPPRECPDCDGRGKWWYQIGPEDWEREWCPHCGGEGVL